MDDNNGIGAMRMQENLMCAKMSDERSVNGDGKIACGKESPRNGTATTTNGAFGQKPTTVQTDSGGRLRFFKDGKLIFELSHHKEGERASWVAVPKKTYWPPRGKCSSLVPVAVAGSSRQESSASLSVSDDNSSVQSSPWQRDHCWKQNHPRKDAGRYLTFLMRPDARAKSARRRNCLVLKHKRRRPFDPAEVMEGSVAVMGGDRPPASAVERKKLMAVVEVLAAKSAEARKVSPVAGCSKADHSVVSPRKRILREFERVSLEDQTNKRHKRPSSSAQVKSPSPPVLGPHINAVRTKGSYSVPASTPSPTSSPSPSSSSSKGKERLGSYSINSLLGRTDEPPESEPSPFLRSLLKSPSRSDQGSSGSSPSCVSSPQSPSEVKWRPSKKKVASPDPPSSHPLPFHQPFSGLNFFPPPAPMMPQYFSPYSRGLWTHPHSAGPVLNYPAAGLLPLGAAWGHTHLGPTAPMPPPFYGDPGKREELAADMPLNLSKNAG
ncbi:protein hairless [Neocloeon triangulifer]|uniref:protein hairless n=1 Tax=Neocloeon triangulifer TaxID=2078957 RepID=UPI00286F0171|nr:protein hairless [Neocloeon triangulifer]XP_059471702.1 protein hairless [Neocloeon triangulifer]